MFLTAGKFPSMLFRPVPYTVMVALVVVLSVVLAAPGVSAGPRVETKEDAYSTTCREAAFAAERRHSIPAGLLGAIAMVESARSRAETGAAGGGKGASAGPAKTAWPWTIHAEGRGRYHESKDEALEAVRELKRKGVTNIDVGCMQVNLRYHPQAFDDLSSAFDPDTNADYAARFVRELFAETKSWSRAVSFYHNRDPKRAREYRRKVMAEWNTQRQFALRALQQASAARVRTAPSAYAASNLRRSTASTARQLRPSPYIRISGATRIRSY